MQIQAALAQTLSSSSLFVIPPFCFPLFFFFLFFQLKDLSVPALQESQEADGDQGGAGAGMQEPGGPVRQGLAGTPQAAQS